MNPNMIKTSNKLIGELENNQLYDQEDEDLTRKDPLNFAGNLELDLGSTLINGASELDLGSARTQPKKQMNFLIKKI